MSKNPEQHLYDSLITQAQQGSWANGFEMRGAHEDPWDLGVLDPNVVHFEAPESQKDRVIELRENLYGLVRGMLIQDAPWETLKTTIHDTLTNPDVERFAAERQANIFFVTPHTMFADLGITAGAAHEVMTNLDPSHPFGTHEDPRHKQTIVAGRILTMLKHPHFNLVTDGLPITEGMMLPLAGVTTTHSANGSSLHTRLHLGHDMVTDMNARTKEIMNQHLTHGNFLVHIALHGSQVKWEQRGVTQKRVMEKVSKGTRELVTGHNQGDVSTHKNIVVGLSFDCPSFDRSGGYSAQNAGVGVVPQVFVPTEAADIDLIMKTLAEHSNIDKQKGLPVFEYREHSELKDREIRRLDEITLTDLRDAA